MRSDLGRRVALLFSTIALGISLNCCAVQIGNKAPIYHARDGESKTIVMSRKAKAEFLNDPLVQRAYGNIDWQGSCHPWSKEDLRVLDRQAVKYDDMYPPTNSSDNMEVELYKKCQELKR